MTRYSRTMSEILGDIRGKSQINEALDPSDTGGQEEVSMAKRQVAAIRHFLDGIEQRVQQEGDMEEWYQNKLTKAHDYLKTIYAYGQGDVAEEVELDEKVDVKSLAKEFEKRITKNNALASDRVQERERHAVLKLAVKSGVDTKALDKAIIDIMNRLDEEVVNEKLNKGFFHSSVEKGKFMKSKYGDENTMYLHDLDNETDEGKPMLVTFDDEKEAEKAAKKFRGKLSKTKMGTFRIVKEEVELDEAKNYEYKDGKVHISRANFRKIHKDYKNSTKGKERMVVLDPKTQQTVSAPVVFTEEVELEEGKSSTGYELYHKDFSSAMQHAYDFAKRKFKINVKPEEIDNKVASGPRKPSRGKTNSYRLEGDKGAIHVQVYGMDNGKYELNMYKESVELDEAQVLAHGNKGKTKVISKGGVARVMIRGKEVASGDYDDGAGGWFMSRKGDRGQKFFDSPQKIADFYKEQFGEEVQVELEESKLSSVAKDLAKYAAQDKKGMDYKDFMKAAAMMKQGKDKELGKFTMDLDTEPRDKIIDMVKTAIGKSAAEKMFNVTIREEEEKPSEPQKPDSAKEVDQMRDDKKKTRVAQLQLQIAKAQETINKLNSQEK